jgi:outer membrane immunogenic protein
MLHRFGLAFASVLALGIGALGAASAADLPLKAKPAPIAVDPGYDWTGFYIGINGGWARDTTNTPGPLIVQPASSGGGAFGGQAGFNYQWNHLVVGIEGDGDWLHLNASALCSNPGFTCNTSLKNQYSVRGRVGGAWGNVLVYATGGGAWATYSGNTTIPATGAVFPASSNRSGWIAGVGVEYAIWKNLIVGVEYLHADYGHQNMTYDVTYPSIGVTDDIVRARLSYKFNWAAPGATPVVAKN